MLTNLTQLLITYLLTYLTVSLLTITTVILSSFLAFPSAIASSVCAHIKAPTLLTISKGHRVKSKKNLTTQHYSVSTRKQRLFTK
jgi:hypothetical protein